MDKQRKEHETWIALRSDLNNNYDYNNKWEEAVILFDKRIRSKYFNPIQILINQKIQQGEGFSIVKFNAPLLKLLLLLERD
jgi:hypothetical protein